jgi:hypothetical protein
MTKEGYTIDGVQCPNPQCKSVRTGCKRAGFDNAGNRIRMRKCSACGLDFNTVEAVAEFVFNRMDVSKLERDRKRNARRIAPGHVAKEFLPHVRGLGQLVVTVQAFEIPRSNKCRRGLHELTDDNIYINSTTGNRKCKACARAAQQAYKQAHPERVREMAEARRARARERARAARASAQKG